MKENTKENETNKLNVVVQKYGGSSVSDDEKLEIVANNVIDTVKKGKKVVVVVSAQGKTTNNLIAEEKSLVGDFEYLQEHDKLVATGEQISAAKLAMLLTYKGYKAKSYLGWQIPIITDSAFSKAKILEVKTDKLINDLEAGYILVVAGFQGVDKNGDLTTLGRGGSDTTAVFIAGVLNSECDIYTDVDGVWSADPRICKEAKKLKYITYDNMLSFSEKGAKVLHDRCVEVAKMLDVNINVKLIAKDVKSEGTKVGKPNEFKENEIIGIGVREELSEKIISIIYNVNNKIAESEIKKASKVLNELGCKKIEESIKINENAIEIKVEKQYIAHDLINKLHNEFIKL